MDSAKGDTISLCLTQEQQDRLLRFLEREAYKAQVRMLKAGKKMEEAGALLASFRSAIDYYRF